MNNLKRMFLLVVVSATMVACKTQEPAPEAPAPDPQPSTPVRDTPTTQPASNPNDHTDPRNLDRADSLLSQRVVYFDFDRAEIRSEFRDVIRAHATYLRANPGARMTLEGHADERGTREYNLGLGERRGNAVSDFVDAAGASSRQLTVVSYGEERPASLCSNESCWSKNRRVEIVYTSRQ